MTFLVATGLQDARTRTWYTSMYYTLVMGKLPTIEAIQTIEAKQFYVLEPD